MVGQKQATSEIDEDESSQAEGFDRAKRSGHLVVLTHGIDTYAHWMDNITPALEKAGFKVAKTGYGVMSPIKFLLPFKRFQDYAINRVVEDIRTAIEVHKPKHVSVIAHSFGTYVIAQIIR